MCAFLLGWEKSRAQSMRRDGLMHRSKTVLFDNLVGTSKQRCGNCEPERFSRDQVINLVKFGRLLDRNVGRYRSAQDLVDGAGGASEQVRVVCSIGHQTRRFDVVSSPMYCRQSRAQR